MYIWLFYDVWESDGFTVIFILKKTKTKQTGNATHSVMPMNLIINDISNYDHISILGKTLDAVTKG